MKKFCFSSMIISIVCLLFAFPYFINLTGEETKPAYSKEYIEYLETEDKSIYGDIIPEVYALPSGDIQTASSIPSYYCLRDEYKIYSTYQDTYGLCWAYTCTTALETMIAKNYNEFYSFSPAWVGLTTKYYWDNNNYTDYELGGGGNMSYFTYAVDKYGLMLESDFDLKDFHSVDDKNYVEIYNLYKDEVIDNLGFDFEVVSYSSPKTNTIKSHILQNGSLYAAIKSSDILNQTSLCTTLPANSDHAVSIIGWDDSYKANDWKRSGAWIAQNSWGDEWGNNGIFYISYDDVVANEVMSGFKPNNVESGEIYVQLSSSSSSTNNLIVNKYTSSKATTTGTFDNQLNIFNEGDIVSLEYSFVANQTFDELQINIFKDGQAVNNRFSNISYDLDKREIYIEANSTATALASLDDGETLSSGTYEIEITFIKNGNKEVITKPLVVFDGLELDSLFYYTDATTQHAKTKQSNFYSSNYNSFNQETLNYQLYAKEHCYLRFYLSTYSTVTDYSYTANSGLTIMKSVANFSPYGTSYSSGYLYFAVHLTNCNSTVATATISLKNQNGKIKTYTFTIYNTKFFTNGFTLTYANVDYNGADGNKTVSRDLAMTSGEKNYLPTPTKKYSTFAGWYTSPNFEESSKLPSDTTGYYITTSLTKSSTGTNFYLNSFETRFGTDIGFDYIHLFAKWDILKYSITYSWVDTSGNVQTEVKEIDAKSNTNIAIKDIATVTEPGYEFVWESGYTDINFDIGIINSLNQNIRITGRYVPKAPTLTSHTIEGEQTSTLSTTYTQTESYKLNVSVAHQANNVTFKYTWKKKDDKGIFRKVVGATTGTYEVFKASHSGEYFCEVVALNDLLGESSKTATSTRFIITIKKAQTVIDTSGMITEFNYDGTIHEVKGATINHSELSGDDIVYENNIVKNVGTGTQIVSVISKATENYTEAVVEVPVKINRAKVTIKIENRRSAVFAEQAAYNYTIKYGEVFAGDDLMLEYKSGTNIYLAGEYNISAIAHNGNYEVEVIDGTYTVYIEGLSLVLLVAGIVILIALICLLTYFIIRKRANDKLLNVNDFDEDIRF